MDAFFIQSFYKGDILIAKQTAEALKEAATIRTLSRRSSVALCIHGINKKFCSTCSKKGRSKKDAAKDAPKEE